MTLQIPEPGLVDAHPLLESLCVFLTGKIVHVSNNSVYKRVKANKGPPFYIF